MEIVNQPADLVIIRFKKKRIPKGEMVLSLETSDLSADAESMDDVAARDLLLQFVGLPEVHNRSLCDPKV